MLYSVTFQQFNAANGRPIDHPSSADFDTNEKGFVMIPNVGDYVQIEPLGTGGPTYSGKVVSRLFRYLGEQNCHVNIVVADAPDEVWGALIKE